MPWKSMNFIAKVAISFLKFRGLKIIMYNVNKIINLKGLKFSIINILITLIFYQIIYLLVL